MADKKSKKSSSSRIPPDKLPSVKPELVTLSQLVKFDPHQITLVNSPDKPSSSKMVSLGKPVQQSQSFAKALTSDYDPFAKQIVASTPAAPVKTKYAKVSPFLPLYDEKLLHIEFHHKNITNPLTLIKYYYPTNPHDGAQQHFYPPDQNKTIQYYQNILQQDGSVEIKTLYDKYSIERKVLNHKIEIIKFTSLKQWGSHPFLLKPFQGHPIKYLYYDYIDAWSKIVLHQNENMSRLWFIAWHEKYNFAKPECQPPMWFIKWWSKHGSQAEIIPDTLWITKRVHPNDPPLSTHTLREALLHFTKVYKCTEYNSRFPPTLLFCAKYKVPWIVKWHYQIKDHVLIRSYAIKWFDKYNKDRINKFVFDEFPIEEVKELEDKPSSSIDDLLKRKSPEELAEICRKATIQCQSANGKLSPASSEGSSNAKEVANLPYTLVTFPLVWYQDSQDPYEGYDAEDLNFD
jgi:hypothetical protein